MQKLQVLLLINLCCISYDRDPIPTIDPTKDKTNILDQRRYDTRVACLNTIVEEATKLRENATDVNEALEEIQGYLHILQALAVEVSHSKANIYKHKLHQLCFDNRFIFTPMLHNGM